MAWEYALIIGIVVGIILGVVIIRLSGNGSQQKALEEELKKTKTELENYRADIAEHFQRSSVLLNNMVKEYSQLYNHFSKASHELTVSDEDQSNPFDFRVVDATSMLVDDENPEQALINLEAPHSEKVADNNVKTKKEPPRDYSEGASGLFRTEPKE